MRQIGGAYRKAWLSDAQKLFVKGKSVVLPLFEYLFEDVRNSTFYISVRRGARARALSLVTLSGAARRAPRAAQSNGSLHLVISTEKG